MELRQRTNDCQLLEWHRVAERRQYHGPAGGTYSGFGFNGTWNGITNSVPTAFFLNGNACTVN